MLSLSPSPPACHLTRCRCRRHRCPRPRRRRPRRRCPVAIACSLAGVIREVRGRFFLCAQVVESQQYQVISSAVSVFVRPLGPVVLGHVLAVFWGTGPVVGRVPSHTLRHAESSCLMPLWCPQRPWIPISAGNPNLPDFPFPPIPDCPQVTLQDTQNQTPYQCHACRTIRPDDCLNQELLLCIPNQVRRLTLHHNPLQFAPLSPSVGSSPSQSPLQSRNRISDPPP